MNGELNCCKARRMIHKCTNAVITPGVLYSPSKLEFHFMDVCWRRVYGSRSRLWLVTPVNLGSVSSDASSLIWREAK